MPITRFWSRQQRQSAKGRREAEVEHKKWVIGQLVVARSISYGLQVNQDYPLTKQEQKKGTPDGKIRQAQRRYKQIARQHEEALSHPWFFEEYMGLGHVFDMPQGATLPGIKTAKEIQHEELREREDRIMSRLEAFAEKHGNVDLRGATQPTIPPLSAAE